jgi:glycosyltransferase involved in cell wall biosynthesis
MPGVSEQLAVAFVVTRLNVGGVARRLQLLATNLGPDLPCVVLAGESGDREGSLAEELRRAGATVIEVPGLRRPASPLGDPQALWWLFRFFLRHRPLVVSTHTAKAGTLGRLAALAAGVPVRVHTFHGHVLEGYFGPVASMVIRGVERALGALTTWIVAVSPEVEADLRRFGIGGGHLTVIRHGFELERLAGGSPLALRTELGIPRDAPVAGIVGRLVPIKNHRLFLDAAVLVRAALPQAHFLIVGDGELWPDLQTQAREPGLTGFVHLTGWRRDLPDVLAAMDVVVCCSINEGAPAALIEACAAGRPIVGTDVGGVADLVVEGVNGHLTPSGDVEALAHAMLRTLRDREAARQMGRAAQRIAEARWGSERLVSEEGALYRRLVERRSSRTAATP